MDEIVLRDWDTDGNGSLDERLYALQDANFNVTAIASTAGAVVERYHYTPYGGRTVLTGAWGSRASTSHYWWHGHQGLYYNATMGLYHNRARHLHPGLGRFVQRDPLGYVDGLSLYQYCRSNPFAYTDDSGLTSISSILREFFWPFSRPPKLWVMNEGDPYTGIVRDWGPVQQDIARLKSAVAGNPALWDHNHRTTPGWVPTMAPTYDPAAGWTSLVASPPGTDPATARRNFAIFMATGMATDDLHTSAIGSFTIVATLDSIDHARCTVKLNIWVYNNMSQRSFGRFANHWFFSWRSMSSQHMWWNWTEEFGFDSAGNVVPVINDPGEW